jgi:FAD binding domain
MTAQASTTQASDAALASAIIDAGAAGSPAAEAELCRRFGRRVRLYGRSRLRDGSVPPNDELPPPPNDGLPAPPRDELPPPPSDGLLAAPALPPAAAPAPPKSLGPADSAPPQPTRGTTAISLRKTRRCCCFTEPSLAARRLCVQSDRKRSWHSSSASVDVAIVERRATQELAGSRAGGLHSRTIEVLDQRGVAERFLAQGKVAQLGSFAMLGDLDISDFPTRHNYGLALWQERIEQLLAAWVAELGIPIYRGREVTGFVQDESGVDVALSEGSSLRAQYLVGCDGGRSLVRKKAGIDFVGWDPSVSYLIAEAEMSGDPSFGIRRGEKGINGLGKLEDGKRVRVVLIEPEVRQGDEPALADLREALIAVYGRTTGFTT